MKKNPARKLRQDAGVGVTESVVAAGLMGIALFIGFQSMNYAVSETIRGRTLLTRDRVITGLVNYSGMQSAIRASVQPDTTLEPFNLPLKECTIGGANPCIHKNGGLGYKGFRLYLPMVENSATPNASGMWSLYTSGAITGTPEKPIRYSPFGDICDTYIMSCPAVDYPIEAFTEFLPYCEEYFQLAAHRVDGRTWNGPIYPDGLQHAPSCYFARYGKVKLTVRPSVDGAEQPRLNFRPFVNVVIVDFTMVFSIRQ